MFSVKLKEEASPNTQGADALALRRLVSGVSLLGVRQFTVQALVAFTGIVLAWMLEPRQFGMYAISTFLFYLFLAIGDLGLGASLIRDPLQPKLDSYRTTFTLRQLLDCCVFSLVWIFSAKLALFYGLGEQEIWFFRFIALAAFINSFQIIPSIQLEREIKFTKLAIIEIAQALAFSIVVLSLVRLGWGVMSFPYAWLAFSLTGAVVAMAVHPWALGWRWDLKEIRSRLPFAIPYQSIGLLHLAKDSVNPILIGSLIGPAAVGYVNWAQMLATFSVLIFSVLQRVYMPSFAALQADRPALGDLFTKVLRVTNLFNAPFAILSLVFVQPITLFVFGEKWLPAIPFFYFFWFANIFGPSVYAALSAFNALGKPRESFRCTLLIALGTWLLGLPLVLGYGAIGFGIAYALVQLLSGLFLVALKKEVPYSVVEIFRGWWPAALAFVLLAVSAERVFHVQSFLSLTLVSIALCASYAFMVWRSLSRR